MPVRAKRVVYFEDPFFKAIHAAQEGEMPAPEGPDAPMGELPLSMRAIAAAPRSSGLSERDFEARMGIGERGGNSRVDPGPAPDPRRSRAAVIADDQDQFEMDYGGQAELVVETLTEGDVAQVEDISNDLEGLEREIASSSIPIRGLDSH